MKLNETPLKGATTHPTHLPKESNTHTRLVQTNTSIILTETQESHFFFSTFYLFYYIETLSRKTFVNADVRR